MPLLIVPEQVQYGSLMSGGGNNLEPFHFQDHYWEKEGMGDAGEFWEDRTDGEGMRAREKKLSEKERDAREIDEIEQEHDRYTLYMLLFLYYFTKEMGERERQRHEEKTCG